MWKIFGLMCSSSKTHYSSYGTLWYNCNLCAKILWKICSSWSSHCAMCSSLCAGYRTLWSLEFTAEGDSTKGKVWQQHQVALEHTQLQQLFVSFLRRSSGNWDWYGDYGIKCPQINSHRQARYKHLNQMECTQHILGVLKPEWTGVDNSDPWPVLRLVDKMGAASVNQWDQQRVHKEVQEGCQVA